MGIVVSGVGLGKAYDVHPLFEDINIGIHEGERVAIIGPNGSGKSTLVHILAGLEAPDSGEVALASGTRLIHLAQQDRFAPESTPEGLISAIVADVHGAEDEGRQARRVGMWLDEAGFDATRRAQPASALSGGWRKRLAIVCACAKEPDAMLMDEPTNHLDLEGIWWLEQIIERSPWTAVIVSHDRFFLERVATRVVEVNKMYPGGLFSSQGGYSNFLEKRAEFVANQHKQQDVLNNQVRREIEWLRMNPAAQMRKSTARIKQAGAMMADLAGLKFRNDQDRRVDIAFAASGRRTNDLVVMDAVAGGRGGRVLFRDLSLTLSPGTRLGVLGLNGCGKTTLLSMLAGTLSPSAGTIRHASNLRTVVFDQKRELLDPKLSLRRALCPSGDTVVYRGRGQHVVAWAKRFLFSNAQLDLPVGKLSGGEQARVLIANLMLKEADLLILDEPTNDLDIPSLEVLEASLRDFPGAVVLVTHDRYLLDRVANIIVALDGRGGAYRIADCGQWEQLAERLQQSAGSTPPPTPEPTATPANRAFSGSTSALSKAQRRELERLPERIEAAEAAVAAAELLTTNPTVMADATRLANACTALATAQADVQQLYARWEALEALAQA